MTTDPHGADRLILTKAGLVVERDGERELINDMQDACAWLTERARLTKGSG